MVFRRKNRSDERSDETELKGHKKIKAFTNNKFSTCTFRIFKLTLVEDTSGSKRFGLNEMDFIGQTSSVPNPKRTKDKCRTKAMKRNIHWFHCLQKEISSPTVHSLTRN